MFRENPVFSLLAAGDVCVAADTYVVLDTPVEDDIAHGASFGDGDHSQHRQSCPKSSSNILRETTRYIKNKRTRQNYSKSKKFRRQKVS